VGANSGTAYGFHLDTDSTVSDFFHTSATCFIEGFATEYVSYTSVNSVQKIWLNSVNKDLTKTGPGLTIITPYDESKSGFVEFRGTPAEGSTTFWSWSAPNFTVTLPGSGVIRGAPETWAGGQSIGLADLATNYIYMDSAGVINTTVKPTEALFSDNIVLFEAWRDGNNLVVTKENHPYKFTSAISSAWHRLFGVLLAPGV
jgi:hypothetical protein